MSCGFLLLAQFFGQMGRGMFEVLYNLLLLKYGYTTAFAGQVIGLSAAVTAVMMPLAGRLGDRRGRRTLHILDGPDECCPSAGAKYYPDGSGRR
ncbi:hypothetical protein SAMN02745885_00005 [Carboxydocella sporoproducens DSM 16521]|uniref:Major Facilitator Superfamily protein n=2 Tax=Carboxydocella TaxID=178898 RepID=A0A1T4L3T6_9FIRM|nr:MULTISPECIES: hypothetical protein [Carboxydocella]AVX19979.1 hypothetical protein CFE_0781 [Carboxydocella thermautotrophica]SJZ49364.1 hypothetical protein SAMN02745885_00005 [Carboxydocella sporoproducens DSM 16521]